MSVSAAPYRLKVPGFRDCGLVLQWAWTWVERRWQVGRTREVLQPSRTPGWGLKAAVLAPVAIAPSFLLLRTQLHGSGKASWALYPLWRVSGIGLSSPVHGPGNPGITEASASQE